MNRVKKMAKWALLIALTFTVLLVAAGLLFEKQILKQLLLQLNEELTQPLEVGKASLSLIKDFPKATVSLNKVRINDHSDSLLLRAESVQFSFGLFDLLNNAIVFDRIRIKDGELHLAIDENGVPNFDILKPSSSKQENTSSIFLQEALLTDVQITYSNKRLSQNISQKVKEARFSGSFAESAFALRSNAACYSDSILFNKNSFLKNLEWGYNAELYVDKIHKKLELNTVSLNIEDSQFLSSGTVRSNEMGQFYDLSFTGNDFDLGTLLSAISDAALYDFNEISCKGKLQLNATIKGQYSKNVFPEINGNIKLENGELDHPKLYYPIEDATMTAAFTNAAKNATGPTVLEISQLKGYVDKKPVEVFFRLENIENPYLDIVTDGELPFREIAHFLPDSLIHNSEGSLIFRTLKFSGLSSQIADPKNWGNVVMKGELECEGLEFEYKKKPIKVLGGYFEYDDTQAKLNALAIKLDDSDILISGTAKNLMPVMFAKLFDSKPNDGMIDFNVSIESERIDVKNVLNTILAEGNESITNENDPNSLKTQTIVALGQSLNVSIEANFKNFIYEKIEGKNFKGSINLTDNVLKIDGSADAMNGQCQAESTIRLQQEPTISAKVFFENIDIKKLFEQGNNLGQNFVRSEHLDGTMHGGALIYSNWDSFLNFDKNELHVLAGVKIVNGRLKNFDLLESFSNYVEIKDLRDVKFATLFNWIEYQDNTFTLPAMFLQNNAMNLTVCGSQSLSGDINYNFKINASQVLQKKLSSKKFKEKLIPAKKDGFFNLYLKLNGTVDSFNYKFAKEEVKTALTQSETDRNRIRRILLDAFRERTRFFAVGGILSTEGNSKDFLDNDETEYIEGF